MQRYTTQALRDSVDIAFVLSDCPSVCSCTKRHCPKLVKIYQCGISIGYTQCVLRNSPTRARPRRNSRPSPFLLGVDAKPQLHPFDHSELFSIFSKKPPFRRGIDDVESYYTSYPTCPLSRSRIKYPAILGCYGLMPCCLGRISTKTPAKTS